MKLASHRALVIWSTIWVVLAAAGLLMFLISRLPVMNPPRCPQYESALPDGSRCRIGVDFLPLMIGVFGVGLAALAALGALATPPSALALRALRTRRERNVHTAQTVRKAAWTPGTPDWAGRYPYTPPAAPETDADTNDVCLASAVTGFCALGFLILFPLLSVPLGVVAVTTATFGLSELNGQPSEARRKALAGISCGGGALLVVLGAFVWYVVTG